VREVRGAREADRVTHLWREAGRLPVSLVRRVCDCGCGQQMILLVAADGAFQIPISTVANAAMMQNAQRAISLGRELYEFWERVRAVIK